MSKWKYSGDSRMLAFLTFFIMIPIIGQIVWLCLLLGIISDRNSHNNPLVNDLNDREIKNIGWTNEN